MLKVGLTGGIASGKTHVLRRLAEAGFQTLDLDAVSRDVMAPGGSAYAGVVAAFGRGILTADGAIDRKALGARVFADEVTRRQLEAIVHPRIREAEAVRLASRTGGGVAVVDAALLVESGQHLRFARMVVVYCDPEEQLRRLMARDGISAAAARARLEAQMPPAEKRQFAHFVIDNSGSPGETDQQVKALAAGLEALASDPSPGPLIPVDRAVAALVAGPPRGPRGLAMTRVLEEVASSGDLDMARLAAVTDPEGDGPWYARRHPDAVAGTSPSHDDAPETLALPIAIWAGARRPGDEPFAIAAAASVARLTHGDPPDLSGAVLVVQAALHFLSTGDAAGMQAKIAAWSEAAVGWTGAAPPASTVATITAAAKLAGDGDAAAQEAGAHGGVADLARALAGGIGAGTPDTPSAPVEDAALRADGALRALVTRILGPRAA